MTFYGAEMNQRTILGHPVGLFVLFFTEMWERFSYYGMRAILVLFLISTLSEGGFGWDRSDASVLYAWYTGLVYLSPLIGGWIADNYMGNRNGVVLGALLMTLGHASMAGETPVTLYLGIALLIAGNGFFKPNITPIVGQMYPEGSPLKDGAYTIFYMGVNAGAFLGISICGWLGETWGWSYGFGCAGIFMFFGMLQFYFGQRIFGKLGERPTKEERQTSIAEKYGEKAVIFTMQDKIMGVVALFLLVGTILAWMNLEIEPIGKKALILLPFVISMVIYLIFRLRKYPAVERDRLTVIAILSFFVIFFWLSFEQAGNSMTIFAEDYTQRTLSSPVALNTFRIISLVLTLIPMLILTWVLVGLGRIIFRDYPLTILFTGVSFTIIWVIIVMINYSNFTSPDVEVPASWFGSLNAFFIISFAPLFSRLWVNLRKANRDPSGPVKFAIGLFLLGIGFVSLVIGASSIPQGAATASVSMVWLILAYFFHTMGELCLSPVGLSFVNKLSPVRLMALMFGVWYLANFVANFTGGIIGSYMDRISETSSLAGFFSIFVFISFIAGIILLIINKPLKRLMHGVE